MPVSAMVVGRLVLGLPSAFGLTIIVLVWSSLTRAGLGFGRACLFSLVAVTIRELIDASAHRLIRRAWRSRDPHGLLLTFIAATCPAVAGFLAARLLAPAATTALTVLTWLPFMAFVALIERPWDTSLGYDALQERIHNRSHRSMSPPTSATPASTSPSSAASHWRTRRCRPHGAEPPRWRSTAATIAALLG